MRTKHDKFFEQKSEKVNLVATFKKVDYKIFDCLIRQINPHEPTSDNRHHTIRISQ